MKMSQKKEDSVSNEWTDVNIKFSSAKKLGLLFATPPLHYISSIFTLYGFLLRIQLKARGFNYRHSINSQVPI